MATVTASEFQKNFGVFKEMAQREPVKVTSNGQESVVLISADEYARYLKLKKSQYACGGEVTEEFKKDVAASIERHRDTLKKLAK